ncbi:LemA family protein [Demequina sediminicola]|uniref:LemA family protein n=1 Tax=Demequina sediminicola TaxID=1095026 RepID=UPI0007836BD3|nr:LemA family protein [Demequina sediminicola]
MEWFFVALALVVVLLILWGIALYNSLIKVRNLVQESWRQIDVELQRRHNLIPNLVETVKGYAAHERETLQAVIEARSAASAPGSSPAQQGAQENALTAALSQLFALSESYPDLKANAQFMELQRELANTEDRIAAGRRIYNANVRTLNTKIEVFPSSVVAGMFAFQREEYFEVIEPAARQTPDVRF